MTNARQRLCDECRQRPATVRDIGDDAHLCQHCISAYTPEFQATWFRDLPSEGGHDDHTDR